MRRQAANKAGLRIAATEIDEVAIELARGRCITAPRAEYRQAGFPLVAHEHAERRVGRRHDRAHVGVRADARARHAFRLRADAVREVAVGRQGRTARYEKYRRSKTGHSASKVGTHHFFLPPNEPNDSGYSTKSAYPPHAYCFSIFRSPRPAEQVVQCLHDLGRLVAGQ